MPADDASTGAVGPGQVTGRPGPPARSAPGHAAPRSVAPARSAPGHAAPRSVVVVGGGLAAAGPVAALRSSGFEGRIAVLGAEGVPPYDRPPLSKELLTRPEPVWLSEAVGADVALADDVRLDEPATGLHADAAGITVRTAHGQVTADAVVLATGAHAALPAAWLAERTPQTPLAERTPHAPHALLTPLTEHTPHALRTPHTPRTPHTLHTLHTAADAEALRPLLTPGARLVVIGAGWIGAEVAGVAARAGVHVTVVEAADAPLATSLGRTVGALTAPWYAEAGIRLLTGTPVTEVLADAVRLATGDELAADVVLVAVGARPTSQWLDGALPLAPDGSVQVDERYRVLGGPAGLFAVGDLARRRSARHGWVTGGHWDGALRGPALAVRTLLGLDGDDHPQDLAPYVFSTQLGHELTLFGQPGPTDDVVLRGDPGRPVGALWFATGSDRLTAALTIDRPRDVGPARKLFAGPELPRLDRTLAADPDRPLRDTRR